MQMMLDGRFHGYERWTAMAAMASSWCLNSREILFGINPSRVAFLDRADLLAGARRRWIAVQKQRLAGWMGDPRAQLRIEVPERAIRPSVVDVIGWVGLDALHARMQFCLSQPYPQRR
jgi:hypothetical protein